MACSTVAITSRVSVVPIVWHAMGCSDPIGTFPAQIVLWVFRVVWKG